MYTKHDVRSRVCFEIFNNLQKFYWLDLGKLEIKVYYFNKINTTMAFLLFPFRKGRNLIWVEIIFDVVNVHFPYLPNKVTLHTF